MAANETQIRIAAVDATKQAFQSVNNNLNGLSSSIKTVAGLLTTAFAGFSLSRIVSETAQYGKEIDRLAQLSGLGVEQFQALSYGAERVGISTEKLADIYKDTQDKVGDFIQTGGGALADFFENIAPKVGVTAEQFRKLNGADALQLYVSSLEKANLSQSDLIFYLEAIASDSALLLPLLQNNGEAFNQLAQEAQNLGIVLDESAIKQSREFADNLARLEALSKTLGRSVANTLIPALNEIASTLLAINKVSDQEGGLFMTLLKLTEIAEFLGVGVTDKVVKAKEEIVKSSTEIKKALDFKPQIDRPLMPRLKKDEVELVDFMEVVKKKIRELDEAFMLEEPAKIVDFFEVIQQRISDFDYENIKNGTTALEEYILAARNLSSQLDNFAVRSLQGLENALVGVFMGTMTVKDAFRSMASSIIADLMRIYIQRSIVGPLADAIFGPLQTVGTRAMGGSVQAGKPYLVGEKGPELFVPTSSGGIVPNNKVAGAGGDGGTIVINQTLNFALGVQQTVRAEVMNMMPQITNATKAAVAEAKLRGGSFAGAFR